MRLSWQCVQNGDGKWCKKSKAVSPVPKCLIPMSKKPESSGLFSIVRRDVAPLYHAFFTIVIVRSLESKDRFLI